MSNIIKIHNKKFNRLRFGIIIVAVAIIAVAAYFFFRPPSQQTTLLVPDTAAKQSQDKYTQADSAVANGDYDKGQAILTEDLKNKTSDIDRSEVYLQQAVLALNNSRLDDAVTFATKAETLYPTRGTAATLAQIAEKANDKAFALKYYKLTVERTTEQAKQLSPDDFDYYQAKVKELSQS